MLKRFFWFLFSCTFPWLVLLIYDNPGGALVALFMQVTIIGWPFAAMWALRTRKEALGLESTRTKNAKK